MLPGLETPRALLQYDVAVRNPVQGRAPARAAFLHLHAHECFKRASQKHIRSTVPSACTGARHACL